MLGGLELLVSLKEWYVNILKNAHYMQPCSPPKIVEEASALIPGLDRYALDKDHLKINKYYGPIDPAFELVSDVIAEMCHRANDVVRRRFESTHSCDLFSTYC